MECTSALILGRGYSLVSAIVAIRYQYNNNIMKENNNANLNTFINI